jgi:hypothetical protein
MEWWLSGFRFRRSVLIASISGGLAFWIYFRSLAPGLLSYDFAEFQYLPAKLGLPHPNGFPFYMLLGWLWSKLPIGTLAFRMNLLSALCGGAATAAFALLLEKLTGQDWLALAGSFFLAFLPAFHFYSTGAERYTLLMFLLLAGLSYPSCSFLSSPVLAFILSFLQASLLSAGSAPDNWSFTFTLSPLPLHSVEVDCAG